MIKRSLANTGMDISAVGFGAWAISGQGWAYAWGPQDDRESIAAIRHAADHGVNWIDTAAAYGLGHSEELVGRALAGMPESGRPFVFTKCGLIADDTGAFTRLITPQTLRREVEGSLRRLNVERIDLYQVHWPATGRPFGYAGEASDQPPDVPVEEYWQFLADLKAEGKVRAIGLSNHDAGLIARAEKVAHVDVSQPPFSAIARAAASDIAWCEGNTTGVIVYSPMHSGLLTGAFTRERAAALPADDWRAAAPDFTTHLDRNLIVADAMRVVATRHAVPVPAVAVAWTLAWPGVTGAIVGARNPAQVDGWLPAADLQLTAHDLDDISAAITHAGAGQGPTRPPKRQ